ncbi:MAG: ABC transporter permease [Oscillospiraceae bacterium]
MSRTQRLLRKPLTAVVLSIFIGLAVGAVVLSVAGYHPGEAYRALVMGIFSKPRYMAQVVIRSTPLILTGLSVAFAFKTGLFNIGAEGQYIVGAVAAALVGTQLSLPPVLHFIACAAAGMLAAALWGAFCGLLKARYGIHEVITCIMLNWIALYFNNFMVNLPWLKKPKTEASYEIADTAWSMVLGHWKTSEEGLAYFANHPQLKDVLIRTDLNYGILITLAVVAVVWFILNRTVIGYELRSVGFNKDAAEFAGVNIKKRMILSMALAGALAGLAGVLQLTGTGLHRINILAAHEGFGFDGISVALVAGSSPVGCVLSGLLFGALKYGSASIQSVVNAPSEVINIVIGVIVFCVAMSTVFPMIADRLELRADKKKAKSAPPDPSPEELPPEAAGEGGNKA